jgi:hypothetical protein
VAIAAFVNSPVLRPGELCPSEPMLAKAKASLEETFADRITHLPADDPIRIAIEQNAKDGKCSTITLRNSEETEGMVCCLVFIDGQLHPLKDVSFPDNISPETLEWVHTIIDSEGLRMTETFHWID